MLRIGLIGLGEVGQVHLAAYQGARDFRVVAISDIDEARLNRVGSAHSVATYTSYLKMLESEALDIACVATPVASHEEITIACARKRINVLCEKPMALSLESATRMIDACEQNGIEFLYGSTYRHLSPIQAARDLIAAGELGDIMLIRESYVGGKGAENFRDMGPVHYPLGGPGGSGMGLVDHGIHFFDIFPWLIGDEVVDVHGLGNISGAPPGSEYCIFKFARGALAILCYNEATWPTVLPQEGMFSWGGAWDSAGYRPPGSWHGEPGSISVHGTKASLRIFHYAHRLYKFGAGGIQEIALPMDAAPAHFAKQMEHFAKAIRGEVPVSPTASDGKTALSWLLKVYGSAA